MLNVISPKSTYFYLIFESNMALLYAYTLIVLEMKFM